MVLPILAPQLAYWYRFAFDQRSRRDVAKATIETFLNTKGLKSAEVTAILDTIAA